MTQIVGIDREQMAQGDGNDVEQAAIKIKVIEMKYAEVTKPAHVVGDDQLAVMVLNTLVVGDRVIPEGAERDDDECRYQNASHDVICTDAYGSAPRAAHERRAFRAGNEAVFGRLGFASIGHFNEGRVGAGSGEWIDAKAQHADKHGAMTWAISRNAALYERTTPKSNERRQRRSTKGLVATGRTLVTFDYLHPFDMYRTESVLPTATAERSSRSSTAERSDLYVGIFRSGERYDRSFPARVTYRLLWVESRRLTPPCSRTNIDHYRWRIRQNR